MCQRERTEGSTIGISNEQRMKSNEQRAMNKQQQAFRLFQGQGSARSNQQSSTRTSNQNGQSAGRAGSNEQSATSNGGEQATSNQQRTNNEQPAINTKSIARINQQRAFRARDQQGAISNQQSSIMTLVEQSQ